MALRKTIEVVARLAEQGVIKQYAIAGAVAAMYYVEPKTTQDLDILISIRDFEEHKSGLILLKPIEDALARMGYTDRTDVGITVEGWPVQFLPASSELDEAGLAAAAEVEIKVDGQLVRARILRAEYIVATALKVGRLKDLARVEEFLDLKAVDLKALKAVLDRFDLMPAWKAFCLKAGKSEMAQLI